MSYEEALEGMDVGAPEMAPIAVPEEAIEMYAARALGLTPAEVMAMGRERVECWLAWAEGVALARQVDGGGEAG